MDRLYRGAVAGIVGGIVMNAWSFFSYHILYFNTRRYTDWMGVIVYGDLPRTLAETLYALMLHLVWVGLLGVLFAYLIPHNNSRGYLLTGAFYGLASGIIIYAIPTLLRTPYISKFPFNTTISNHIGAILWGVTLAYTLRWLYNSSKLDS